MVTPWRRLGREVLPALGVAVISMILGILVGLPRLVTIYSPGYTGGIVGFLHERLYMVYDYHSSLIIIGFIAVLITVERISGLPRGMEMFRYILLIALVSFVSGTILLLANRLLELGLPVTLLSYPLLLGTLSMAYFYIGVRRYIPSPSLSLFLAAYLSLLLAILNMVLFQVLPYDLYGTILLLYPLLFIMGERVELTRFLGGPGRPLTMLSMASPSIPLVIMASPYLDMPMLGRAYYIVVMSALLLLLITRDYRLRGSPGVDPYLHNHLMASYLWLAISLVAYLYISLAGEWFYTDIVLHTAALGYIGNMLLGHAPIVFRAITGIDLGRSYLATAALNLGIILRILASITSYTGAYEAAAALALISGLSILAVPPLKIVPAILDGISGDASKPGS